MITALIVSAFVDDAFESYLAHIFSAQASLNMNDTSLALRWLRGAVGEHREWEFDYLLSQTDTSEWFRSVDDDPSRIEFSPNGLYAATANLNGTATIYDGETLRVLGHLEGHTNEVWGLAFTPDSKSVITTSRDTTVRIWDVESRKEIAVIGKHPTTPYSVAVSPDGKWAVTPGWKMDAETRSPVGMISVWDLAERKLHKQWSVTTHPIAAAAFSADGRYAAFGCWEYQTLIYNTADWSIARVINPLPSETYKAVDWVEFSADGRQILTACKDKSARLFDLTRDGAPLVLGANGNVTCARFSQDGSIVVSSTDQNLRVFTPDGRLLSTLRGHTDSVRSFALNRDRIVSVGEDKTMRGWRLVPRQLSFDVGEQCWSAVPSPDGRLLATGSGENCVSIWTSAGKHVRDLTGPEQLVVDVSWSPDGARVIAGSNDGTARIWTIEDGKELHVFRVGQRGQVRGVAWSPSIDMVAVGQGDSLVRWNPTTGIKLGETTIDSGAYAVSISPNGEWIAVGGSEKGVTLVHASDGSIGRRLADAPASVYEIAWSKDSSMIAAAGAGGAIQLWNVDGRKHGRSTSMTLDCWGLAFSPNGKRLAATGYDFSTRLFDVASMKEVIQFRDMPGIGFDIHWSPDGRRLIHADTDGRVTVFDAFPKSGHLKP